ncbi:UDP-N-acetylmuramoyl-tripeptide--D-alanyl-D-alanine ligase [Lysinibacillus composti]|uniref:UDP-N-acetylmuramoyl-tripeptide--D-alanyl-D-alanine ligase n=1 Tax=Lysinibacillus composti TaxID=720633 RepID=A0A3N9UQB6_9BACI|nr:UDP-N-acetylmuramoyl-tripeptide--D-alanyl-D-alanine ligase [Lysinibacillus composti]MBM7608434.1 UDP-N-acetylmuramoyl-tripeptide--D-alanyl-D-alanine ligase [Lysinibacillus composti]RQW74732.1 UDP-N-acetylmuramoyl-tripeptide--D-alanyl-D-alanine ligase [Lysinibacillus composti]
MKPLLLEDIFDALDLTIPEEQKGIIISNVVHDSTYATHQTLYFYIRKKDHPDGEKLKHYKNLFIITDRPFTNMEALQPEQIFMVDNIMDIFFKFTTYYRSLFTLPVLSITGTCGKTTTKEMIKHILQSSYTVQATVSNKNSSYFHLQYLVGIDENTDVAVIETGISEPGEMEEAFSYFAPSIGIMTMIDIDHTGEFQSFENYVKEKAKMIDLLPPDGTLIINIDDPHISSMRINDFKGKLITFGKNSNASFHIKETNYSENSMEFTFEHDGLEYKGVIPGLGEHNVYNAIAAFIGANEVNIDIETSIKLLTSFSHLPRRFQKIQLPNDILIIDDTWKFNVPSFHIGIEVLSKIAAPNQRKIVVLGRHGSIGEYAEEEYKKFGKKLVEQGIHKLITKGFIVKDISRAALRAGMSKRDVHHFSEIKELQTFLLDLLQPGDIVYFKAVASDESFVDIIKYFKNKN